MEVILEMRQVIDAWIFENVKGIQGIEVILSLKSLGNR